MAENSKIQWTGNTWNPWHGCKKVSDGCKFCYMYRDKERYGQDPTTVIRSAPATFNKPLTWKDPALVFTCSWSDWFIDEADEWRADAWEIVKKTPHLTYQILTKRPERISQCLPSDWGEGYENVWVGVSVENQKSADIRIPILSNIPAQIRFLSCEPLLSPIELNYPALNWIHWVIVGGESGNENGKYRYRPCEIDWMKSIVDKCQIAGVSVFVKQLGTHLAKEMGLKDHHGGNIDEWPNHLQIREFPL